MLDDNDHPPVFSLPNYVFQVSEDINSDHLVGTVTASDKDEGINAQISYLIKADNGSEFTIII